MPDVSTRLVANPLFGLTLTLLVYQVAVIVHRRAGSVSILHPVATSILGLGALLTMAGIPYERYLESTQALHLLLGPVTVAIAVPLYLHFEKVRERIVPLLGALLVGCVTAVVSSIALGWVFHASPMALLSMAPKSATAPVAMGIAQKVGAPAALTAVLTIFTGILGAVAGKGVLDLAGIRDDSARGFAIGLTSHGIGTARAFQISQVAGTFSGLAMGLNAMATALLAPVVVRAFGLH